MHRAILFNGIVVFIVCLLVFFLDGKQARREMDEQMNEGYRAQQNMDMGEMVTSQDSAMKIDTT
jgi:hypothetical protein